MPLAYTLDRYTSVPIGQPRRTYAGRALVEISKISVFVNVN